MHSVVTCPPPGFGFFMPCFELLWPLTYYSLDGSLCLPLAAHAGPSFHEGSAGIESRKYCGYVCQLLFGDGKAAVGEFHVPSKAYILG